MPDDDGANPAGNDDWGSSTVCSWVPVSCPEAAGTGDSGAAGAEDTAAEDAADGADPAGGLDELGVEYGTPLVAQPVTSTSAAAAQPNRTLETDDTVLPNPGRTSTPDNVPSRVSGPHVAGDPRTWIMSLNEGAAAEERN